MVTGLQSPVQVTRDCRDNSFLKISLQNFHSGSPDDSCFLKSGDSTFPKSVGSLFSEICGNKITACTFNSSYAGGEITEEQLDLYGRLKYRLDEVYIMADMVLSNYRDTPDAS